MRFSFSKLMTNALTSDILKDIMCQMPMEDYAQFIGRLPDGFFQIEDIHRQTILKDVRHRIIHDGQKDPNELAEIVRLSLAQPVDHPINC